MVFSANSVRRLPDFFSEERLDEIQSHVDALFKDQPEIPFIKKGDTGLAAKEVIDRSRYSDFFDELSIDYENSYVNVSKPRTEEGWHYDHSEYTLIVPVFLKNTDQGTVYSHFLRSDKGLLKKVTTALNFLTIFLARRKETFRTNDGLLTPGTKLYHSAPAVDPGAVRISLVVHLCTLAQRKQP